MKNKRFLKGRCKNSREIQQAIHGKKFHFNFFDLAISRFIAHQDSADRSG